MPRSEATRNEIDPRLTEACLRGVPGVIEARAWFVDDAIVAEVTVSEWFEQTARDLQHRVLTELGLHQTPLRISLECCRLLAA